MLKNFEMPELELISFDVEDIITTSTDVGTGGLPAIKPPSAND